MKYLIYFVNKRYYKPNSFKLNEFLFYSHISLLLHIREKI